MPRLARRSPDLARVLPELALPVWDFLAQGLRDWGAGPG